MARPKRARLKVDPERLELDKKANLDIDGLSGGGGASTIRIKGYVSSRVAGVPTSRLIIDADIGPVAANTAFSLAAPVPFIPRQKTVYTFRILAWDITPAAAAAAKLKDVKTHVLRLQVKPTPGVG